MGTDTTTVSFFLISKTAIVQAVIHTVVYLQAIFHKYMIILCRCKQTCDVRKTVTAL